MVRKEDLGMQVKNPTLKSKIIEAARICFFKYGYKNTFLDMIAKETFTTASNLYNYFDGKEEIFDEVIGDIPFQIDTYISTYYYETVKNMRDVQLNMDLESLFPETLIFSKKVSMTLWILLEGAEGTQYAQYKEGLYGIIDDCTRKANPDINLMLGKIFRESFLNKILSITKTVDKEKSELEIDNELEEKEGEFYSFYLDTNKKIFQIKSIRWVPSATKELLEIFFRKYEKRIQTINTHEYELVIDCRLMPNVADYEMLTLVFAHYHGSNFLKVKCLLNPSQIALSVVLKRIFLSVGCTRIEICMKHEN